MLHNFILRSLMAGGRTVTNKIPGVLIFSISKTRLLQACVEEITSLAIITEESISIRGVWHIRLCLWWEGSLHRCHHGRSPETQLE